jgi:glycerol uptake facilitator-like aquaporin
MLSLYVLGIAGLQYVWIYLTAPLVGAALAVVAFIALHKDIRVDTELQDTGDGGL